jgi:N-acetylglucosamine kinase-like BadF-type ATPase
VSRFLGVDGGGTKTALCLVSGEGDVLAQLEAPGCYYLGSARGVALVADVLAQAVPEVCDRAGIVPPEIDYAFFGLPVYGEVSGDLSALDAAPREVLGHGRYRCANDMVAGWAGSLGLDDGINVVSGTGSIGYGQRGERVARVGGWGELFGDEGSGYWIGVRGLQAGSQMSDGRLSPGPLLELLRERLVLDQDLDLVDVVLNRWSSDRRQVAALSRLVVDAARLGDSLAAQIVADAATELTRMVEAIRRELGFSPADTVPVSYSGGVFSAAEILAEFQARLEASSTVYQLRVPQFSPVIGAVLYAARLAGVPLVGSALERLRVQSRRPSGAAPATP